MPTYQCPRCQQAFTAHSTGLIPQCPSCEAGPPEDGWYCRIGGNIIGPITPETINELVESNSVLAHSAAEWNTPQPLPGVRPTPSPIVDPPAGSIPEESAVADPAPDPTPVAESVAVRPRRFSHAVAWLLLVAVAVSGWVFHFVIEADRRQRLSVQAAQEPEDDDRQPRRPVADARWKPVRAVKPFDGVAQPAVVNVMPVVVRPQKKPVGAGLRVKPRLLNVFPQAFQLPANLSKVHLRFTEPMAQKKALQYLSLTQLAKKPKPLALPRALRWSEDGQICTIDFSKQPFKVGERYRLEISGKWPSTLGVPLGRDHAKAFRADKVDRRPPRASQWSLKFPKHERTHHPLHCRMKESLDWAQLIRELVILDEKGRPVEGNFTINSLERNWMFRPTQPWQPGRYTLSIGHQIEDLAGNRVVGRSGRSKPTKVSFVVKKRK